MFYFELIAGDGRPPSAEAAPGDRGGILSESSPRRAQTPARDRADDNDDDDGLDAFDDDSGDDDDNDDDDRRHVVHRHLSRIRITDISTCSRNSFSVVAMLSTDTFAPGLRMKMKI